MVSGHGGGTISKRMLLAMIIVINVSLLSLGDISATTNNLDEIESNITHETSSYNNNNNSQNDTDTQLNNSSNNSGNTSSNTVIIHNITEAAGEEDAYSNVHGIWLPF